MANNNFLLHAKSCQSITVVLSGDQGVCTGTTMVDLTINITGGQAPYQA